MTVTVFGYLISNRFLQFYFSVFSLVLVSIEKIYQTLMTAFNHISQHLEYSAFFFFFCILFIYLFYFTGIRQEHTDQYVETLQNLQQIP